MSSTTFFDEMSEQSEIKTLLVQKYFEVWANVMIATQKQYPKYAQRIAYIDLFAGPGRYKNGQISTPISVLRLAIQNPAIRERLVTIFNDKNEDNTNSLRQAIDDLPGIETLGHKPKVWNIEIGDDVAKKLETLKLVPTLFFIDPWGYKGLSLRLINAVVKDFGCDCLFFFNFNRINMGINNDAVISHMDALFGKGKAENMRTKLLGMTPNEREFFILNELSEALRGMGAKFVLPFTFKDARGTRTSHHLIFVSKHVRGYEKMKGIMARHSSTVEQGVASFDFNPVENKQLSLLYDLSRPLDELGAKLTQRFAGQSLQMYEIYSAHQAGTPYIAANYKDVLNMLEEQGKVQCEPPAANRLMKNGKRTFGDKVVVTFPKIEGAAIP